MTSKKIAFIGLLIAVVGMGALAGLGAAQSTSPVAEVPGLDANETGEITVDVEWNENATESDVANVSIDYIGADDSEIQTDEHTINGSSSTTTSGTFTVAPDQDVERFEVTTEAVQENVSNVNVTSDIEATSGGSVPTFGEEETGGIIGGVILIGLIGAIWYRRTQ